MAAVEIVHKGTRHRFECHESGQWYLHDHGHGSGHETDADDHHHIDAERSRNIGKALRMFSRINSDRLIAAGKSKADTFGVENPPMVVMVFTEDGVRPAISLHVGDMAPDGIGRYVFVAQKETVVIVPNYHIENLEKLIQSVGSEHHIH
jgi:hypothetical protein